MRRSQLLIGLMLLVSGAVGFWIATHQSEPVIYTHRIDTSAVQPGAPTAYRDFTDADYAAFLGVKPFALFFAADWCEKCLALEEDLHRRAAELPEGFIILRVPYDTATELKQTYSVTLQDTVVILNAAGTVHRTIIDPTFDDLVQEYRVVSPSL